MIKTVIVEDDRMVAAINNQFALKTPGVQVIATFYNGKDALAFLKETKVDLLLLDLYMPEYSGLELLTDLRRQNLNIDVIMITAANDIVHIEQALHLGIIDYLIKPFQYERFSIAMDKFLLRKKVMENGLESIRTSLNKHSNAYLTSEQIAEETGLSKVTVRRYMNFLIEQNEIISRIDYETGGRPRVEYCTNHPVKN